MKLIIKRNQDTGFWGSMKFLLHAHAELTTEERELINKYKAHQEVLFTDGSGKARTISDLLNGIDEKAKDVRVLLNNEDVFKQGCEHLKTLLSVMASFGGEEVFEY